MAQRPATDVFRPCLPFDPFAGAEPGPWKPFISPHADPPAAVLVLGDPEPTDLHPILFSQSLANSLIVIITHAPPYIPRTPLPAVRILRLATSLVHDAGAIRLVGLVERADRVVRRFRVDWTESSRKLVQLAENSATGEFDMEEEYSVKEPPSPSRMMMRLGEGHDFIPRYPSPAPSATSSLSSSASSSVSAFSTASAPAISRRRRSHVSSSRPPADRAFDAIINFLPSSLPDKFLLKHAILVSTLSASFVTAPPAHIPSSTLPPSAKSRQRSSDGYIPHSAKEKKSRRFSALLRRTPATNPVPFLHSAPDIHDQCTKGKSRSQVRLTPYSRKPHLVHILPPHVYHHHHHHHYHHHHQAMGAPDSSKKPLQQKSSKAKPKPKLVQSIEQFLLAFGYPLQSMSLLPSSVSNSSLGSKRLSVSSTMSSNFSSASAAGFGTDGTGGKPIPFLLPAGVLGSTPAGGRLSIGEILLMGGFDNSSSGFAVQNEEGMAGMEMEESRVWIGSPDDVVWDDDLESLSTGPMHNSSAFSSLLRDSTHGSLHAPSPTHPRSRPIRSSSLPIPGPHELASPAASPPSIQLAPSNPAPTKSLSFPSPLAAPLPPPAPIHTPNGKLTKPNLLSKAKSKRWSTPSSLSPSSSQYSETNVSKELKQKQLPTPPDSASSLEDGNDDDDDRMTSETSIVETGSLPSVAASTTDHHLSLRHQHHQHQQSQGKAHCIKAASTLGHGHVNMERPVGNSSGKNMKEFLARFGFGLGMGMGKWKMLKAGERVGEN